MYSVIPISLQLVQFQEAPKIENGVFILNLFIHLIQNIYIIISLVVINVIITFLQIGANVRSILEIAFCTFVEYFFRWILSTSFSRSRIFFATRYFKVHGRSSHKTSYSSQMISRLSYPLCRTPCNQIVIRIVYWPSYFLMSIE